MSSFYDLASLVMIPSGKKAGKVYSQKPLTTDGQLDFTRASTATRIGSDGNIEKTRTNLVLQSNQFDTTWTISNVTLTSGQSGYDGTNNAWLLNSSLSGGYLRQNLSGVSGMNTYSLYVKAGSVSWVQLTGFGNTYFNLSGSGAVGNTSAIAKIESVGSGWFRCSVTGDTSPSQVRIYSASADGVNASGTIYIQDAQIEPGLVATNVITTTTAAVSVGSVDNMPRLNYTPGSATSCPSLLLEPQRTNVVTHSEYFEASDWNKNSSTVLSNQITSPENTNNASKLSDKTTFNRHSLWRNYTTSSTNNTISIFAKKGTKKHFSIYTSDTTTWNTMLVVDLEAGTITKEYNKIGFTSINTIESYANGWYRIVAAISGTQSGNALYTRFAIQDEAEPANPPDNKYTGDGTGNVYIYGAQVELGASYATSYIPTFGATVTRTQDRCNKDGISGLIGQTAGTVYFDWVMNHESVGTSEDLYALVLSDNTSNKLIGINNYNNTLAVFIKEVSTQFYNNSFSGSDGLNIKLALAYANNDVALYINGNQIATDTSASIPALNQINLNTFYNENLPDSTKVNNLMLFKTRLSNTQLAELTSIDS